MNISTDVKLDFNDVRLVPNFSNINSRSEITLTRDFNFGKTAFTNVIPVIAANMDGVGTFEVAEALQTHNVMTALVKTYSVGQLIQFFSTSRPTTFYSLGVNDEDYTKLLTVANKVDINKICLDTPNGYIDKFYDTINKLRKDFPDSIIMAGNVVTADAVIKAKQNGATIVKVGIGSGQMCKTRLVTGVGYPQLSAVMECAEVDAYICSDGGCSYAGDISIALAAGAQFVMLGSMLAGTTEGGGKIVNGNVEFYGMSSKTANDKHFGGLKNYRSSEGRTVSIPHKGSINEVISNILGGVRSTCAYVGASSIKDLSYSANFIRVNNTHNNTYESHTIGN